MTPEDKAILDRINERTFRSSWALKERIRSAQEAAADSQRERRERARRCVFCFYMRRDVLAGQAFTDSSCHLCAATISNSTTDVDWCCTECADRYGVCVYCGGDRELKTRRTRLEKK